MTADLPAMSPRHVMVVFGAGASFDSIADAQNRAVLIGGAFQRENRVSDEAVYERLDWRPPRTSDLFGVRARFQRAIANYPGAGVLIDGKLRGLDAKTNSVEAVLDTLSGEARESPALRRQLASLRFYLREVLWQCGDNWENEVAPAQTNYHRMVERLVRWQERRKAAGGATRITLVTFNYDLMLDRAVRAHARLKLDTLDGYTEREDFRYFKPHGSVNWARAAGVVPRADSKLRSDVPLQRLLLGSDLLIDMAGEDPTGIPGSAGGWHVINEWTETLVHTPAGATLVFPALTIPVVSKDSFEMPTGHVEMLKAAIDTVTYLLIVGWRAQEANFLDLWPEYRQSRPVLQVVGTPTGSVETTNTLVARGIPARAVEPVKVGFSGFLGNAYTDDSELDRFLAQSLGTLG